MANGATCPLPGLTVPVNGTYTNGLCTRSTPDGTAPTPPSTVFTPETTNAGSLPSGTQPMRVNTSPFLGGGFGIVSGTVLCYTAAGKMTDIFAYSDDNVGGVSFGGFNSGAWNSLTKRDLYASDDITAQGTLSVFGGAQIYSLDGKSALQVNNAGVLMASTDGAGNISSLMVNGSTGVSIIANRATGGEAVSIYGKNGDSSTARIGVLVSGDGQGDAEDYVSGTAPWSDVLIASKSYMPGGTDGSGIIVNDYGVTIRSETDSSMVVIHGALDFVTENGDSILNPGLDTLASGGTLTSMVGSTSRYAVTDSNGRVTVVEGPVPEANSATYVVNGNGMVNAVTVTERNAVLSGGETQPTTLMLSDTGAQFSNSTNGDPVVVSGVFDGGGAFDAANIRQLDSGLASVPALAGLPAPQQGKTNSVGVAFGQHGSGSALAMGGQSIIGNNLSMKYGAAVAYSHGLFKSSASLGLGASW